MGRAAMYPCFFGLQLYPPSPPLRKHQESLENDGPTGSRCLDKAVVAHNPLSQKDVCHQKPTHTSPEAQ